jgi:hypothetical protein
MEIHKPREKGKGISERGDSNARIGSVYKNKMSEMEMI